MCVAKCGALHTLIKSMTMLEQSKFIAHSCTMGGIQLGGQCIKCMINKQRNMSVLLATLVLAVLKLRVLFVMEIFGWCSVRTVSSFYYIS